ncbi:hypothetical protein PV327_009976 [Microctonus hyperodae]|uniref:Thioredoxin-like fold domain-containing protein n=2 Tax=Microctonus hyperodae TaxID=165561 RepID=A0AA39KG85_MICHY|nr:hypothetical protein PV327_009976 [Microctonus hyperodae]
MCGQENKKMTIQDTVEILTNECIQLRQELRTIKNISEKEKIVLKHIKCYSEINNHINDFPKGLEWFNVPVGLSITQDLAGKIIVLDFFTYCCINCMHILPDLCALETKYSIQDGLIVIGVHSAKFSNEKDSGKILSAIQRYNIAHPVINDNKLSMWRNLGVNCWPTLIILGPKGQPLFVLMGEGHRDELFIYTKVAINYFKSLKQISNHNIPLSPAHHLLPVRENVLRFPSKIQTFLNGNYEKIVISDTGNNRIVVMKLGGFVEHIIGGQSSGFRDGGFDEARFNAPQGICVLNNSIYVADTENHAIRLIDLEKKIVTTVVGTGSQGHDYVGGKFGKEQALSSPWDVAIYHHNQNEETVPIVLIAIAGTHQIWALFLKDTFWWKKKEYKAGTCAAIVGNGKEENRNNAYPHAASLAQPSGLAVAQELQSVFFADSESSSIRKIHLQDGKVTGVAGGDKNPADLHKFGDVDGVKYSVKLQHPLGVAWDSSKNIIYVADTYNHKIKIVDVAGKCETLCGDGKPTKSHTFDEPSGLAVLPKTNALLIADTNNHCIKMLDRNDGSITTISIEFPGSTSSKAEKVFNFDTELSNKNAKLKLFLAVKFDSDVKLNPDAPQSWMINSLPDTWSAKASTDVIGSPIILTAPEENSESKILITLNLITCKTDQCIPKKIDVIFIVKRNSAAPNAVEESKQLKIN